MFGPAYHSRVWSNHEPHSAFPARNKCTKSSKLSHYIINTYMYTRLG